MEPDSYQSLYIYQFIRNVPDENVGDAISKIQAEGGSTGKK